MGACIPKHIHPTPLSVDSLLSVQKSLANSSQESDAMLSVCLDHALREFPREPRRLQDNATLTVQVKGRKRMEFASGTGEHKIMVSWFKKCTRYNVEVFSLEVYLERMSLSPPLLTIENLEKVKQDLLRWDDATKELRACLDVALVEIEKEPPSVISNAELTIECGGFCLDFISGKGRSRIRIVFTDKKPRYQVRVSSMNVYLDRLSCHAMPLNAENLLKAWKEAERLKGCTVDLRACLKRAMQEFNSLSSHHRANATIFIDCDGKSFKMVSGHGESWISIFNIVGDQHCRREVVLALADAGPTSRLIRPSTGKRPKEGPSFWAKRLEGRKGAEEGPSSEAKRTSDVSKVLPNRKRSNVVTLEDFATCSRKEEEETASSRTRTLSSGKRVDTGQSRCSQTEERETSSTSKELLLNGKGKVSDGGSGKGSGLAGLLSISSGSSTEELLMIHGKFEEIVKEIEPSNGSSEEEIEVEELTDVLSESLDSQTNGGPER